MEIGNTEHWISDWLISVGLAAERVPLVALGVDVCILMIVAILADVISKRIVLRIIEKAVKRSSSTLDDIFFEKKVGLVTGWIGYTLSWTNRQFENVNFGEIFPYRYDRRHDVSFVLTYKPNETMDIGLVWVYGTGNAYTLGLERYNQYTGYFKSNGEVYRPEIEHIESRNNFRAPAYHRLDLGFNMHKKTNWGTRTWSIGLYNAYSRQNPFYIYWGYEDGPLSGNSRRVLKQVALFPIIPSISYAFKF